MIEKRKIINVITGLNQGGAETALLRLLRYYEFDDDIYVISLTGKGYLNEEFDKLNVTVINYQFNNWRKCLSELFEFIKLVKKVKPDVIQTWMYHSDFLGGLVGFFFSKAKIYWNIRNGNISKKFLPFTTRIVIRACGILSRWIPDKVISCSREIIAVHAKVGYSKEKFVTIFNGVETDIFKPGIPDWEIMPSEYRNRSEYFKIGNVSRWHKLKDHETLLKAFKRTLLDHPKCLLILVGKEMTVLNSELFRLIENIGVTNNVILLGQCNEIVNIYRTFDLHVLSSVGEGFPNVVAESMSCGVLNVVTNVGDAVLICDDMELVSPPQDEEKLANCILRAKVILEEKSPEFSRNIRAKITNRFSIQNMSSQYAELWKQ